MGYPEPVEVAAMRTCGDCVYCREACDELHVCVFDAFHADTFRELSTTEVSLVMPETEACKDFHHYEDV